ncbi:hypothetical protein GCM10011352_40960 [Marinobacterium zhoushanense]|uniref:Heavy-metal resistance protein n=1 Tax=Marinobacterium zhoushanense TaxID=1679163 RepID=A0ABQ1KTQ3_9GAMM|nr:hypothetical protein [Marinobacterium zhoushanense]GGC10278.1 hypothetical protein GCM10011352_40960 [Marinobacterium zhoushanense]
MKLFFLGLMLLGLNTVHATAADYSGQQMREIKSLSVEDVESIRLGKGWSLAKPAELNGYPGPRHVLDLAGELALTADQQRTMEQQFAAMKARAVAVGQRYLQAEQTIEQAFRTGQVDANSLSALLETSARAHAELRQVHLDSHLLTKQVLTPLQIADYSRLRGYDTGADAKHMH